jgi:GTPase SAR1 family protein
MGSLFSKNAKIIILGLDNSGKTTIINRIKDPAHHNYSITPTVGFQI